MNTRKLAVAVVIPAGGPAAGSPAARSLAASRRTVEVEGHFSVDEGLNLSGIACTPADANGKRTCLVIDDEGKEAQYATIDGDRTIRLLPGAAIRLIGKEDEVSAVGTKPEVTTCPNGKGKFKEFDGEGVAYDGKFFYVVGSHGCGRNNGKFRASTFLLARLNPEKRDKEPKLTWRVSDALASAPEIGSFFGKGLMDGAKGLNIEGLAIAGGRAYFGLRAPSLDANAYLVGTSVEALFAKGEDKLAEAGMITRLPLGPNTGIRDLAYALSDTGFGTIYILAGPTEEQAEVDYRIYAFDGASTRLCATLAGDDIPVSEETDADGNPKPAKAEALEILGMRDGGVEALILFDGVKDGGPGTMRAARAARRGK